ncbi:neprilysin-1 isoform X2 [Rhipicephalus sanguineus]|uniref:neprilysin-1 isoform X2 n=1 Tax=Rhipicephalus sanguineus TaxID=34632 RepID=UPI001893DABE|nr:neprilysin-1 isoform X2 [Rhipicephalus sanguineus]
MHLLTAMVYLLAPTLCWIFPRNLSLAAPKAKDKNYTVCETEVCRKRAKLLQESINRSVDPCDDFFSYVCDGWNKRHPIPKDESSYGMYEQTDESVMHELKGIIERIRIFTEPRNLTEMAATLYKACMSHYFSDWELLKIVKDILSRSGFPLWPVIKPSDVPYKNYSELLVETTLRPLFYVDVAEDINDTTRFIIELDQMPFDILKRNELIDQNDTDNNNNTRVRNAYINLITTAVGVLNRTVTRDDAVAVAERIFLFEAQLAKMTAPPDERRDTMAIYEKTTIQIPVLQGLKKLFSLVNITINETEEVAMFGMPYFKKTNDFFGCLYDLSDMYNMAAWRHMFELLLMASRKFSEAWQALLKIVDGVPKEKPRWQYCLNNVLDTMPFVAGRMYVEKIFDMKSKTDVEAMIKNVTSTFRESLISRPWMNDSTRDTALKKLERMAMKIGYPPWIFNDTHMKERFRYVKDFSQRDSFLKIITLFDENASVRRLLQLRMVPDRANSWTSPVVVNAFYRFETNDMVFPAAILRDSFYQRGLPASVNYGAIGTIIGHEMIHGFDEEGKDYDEDGRLRNWWSNKTLQRFRRKAECFVRQYSSVFSELANRTLNGVNTLSENIADNGGLRMAFRTLGDKLKAFVEPDIRLPGLEEYSPKQLFFISAAFVWCGSIRPEALRLQIEYDPHSPHKQRINVSLRNMKSFTSIFKCNETSKMWFKKKSNETCVLW